jgi:hypothetical protein
VQPDRSDGRPRQGRAREYRAAEVREQAQGGAMQLQPEGIGAEAMTTEPVGVEVELEFLDPILRRAAVVVPGDEVSRRAAAVGDHAAHVAALGRDIDLDQNASGVQPGFRAMPEAGADEQRAGSFADTGPRPSRRGRPRAP